MHVQLLLGALVLVHVCADAISDAAINTATITGSFCTAQKAANIVPEWRGLKHRVIQSKSAYPAETNKKTPTEVMVVFVLTKYLILTIINRNQRRSHNQKIQLMKVSIRRLLIALALVLPWNIFAQGTAFTYQGLLNNGASPASGSYDMTFTLFAANTGGVAIAGPVTNSATIVSNGLFTALVNLGPGAFIGASNWLEIAVRTNGAGTFNTLAPRQQVTPTPYAVTAENVIGLTTQNATNITSGTLADARLSSNVALRNASQTFTGQNTFSSGVVANTIAPASQLTIAGDILMSGGANVYHNFSLTGGNSAGFLYGSYPAFGDGIHLGYNFYADNSGTTHIPNTGGGTSRITVGYGSISLLTGGVNLAPSSGVTINSEGYVGIGTAAPADQLDVNGYIHCDLGINLTGDGTTQNWYIEDYGGGLEFLNYDAGDVGALIYATDGSYHQFSDVRMKRDITNLDNTLDRLLQLRPVSYRFRSAPKNAPLSLGLIAQEVQPLFPEVVGEGPNGMKDLAYSELVPVTIRSIQELNQKLETQLKQRDTEIQDLKDSNDALAKQLNQLQAAVQALQEKK